MTPPVNPEMLILARESRGLTQSQLARDANISQGALSKYESELLNVNEAHLKQLARVLDYPVEFFSLPERRYGFGSSCTYNRKRQTTPARQLNILLARLNIRRIQVARLLTGAEIDADNTFERLDVDEFEGDIERIAEHVRDAWKLPPGPISNLVQAIESAGGVVIRCSFGTRKLDAISQWISGPPLFLINADKSGDRVRFTLAHEVGHIIMHEAPTQRMEWEADRFASALLMPAREITPDLDGLTLPKLAQLKAYWKVSMAALITRARDLGKITDRQYRALFEQLGKSGYRINEPVSIPIEEPGLIKEIIQFYQNEQQYSISELSKMVVLHQHECRREYGLGDRRFRIIGGTHPSSTAG